MPLRIELDGTRGTVHVNVVRLLRLGDEPGLPDSCGACDCWRQRPQEYAGRVCKIVVHFEADLAGKMAGNCRVTSRWKDSTEHGVGVVKRARAQAHVEAGVDRLSGWAFVALEGRPR